MELLDKGDTPAVQIEILLFMAPVEQLRRVLRKISRSQCQLTLSSQLMAAVWKTEEVSKTPLNVMVSPIPIGPRIV